MFFTPLSKDNLTASIVTSSLILYPYGNMSHIAKPKTTIYLRLAIRYFAFLQCLYFLSITICRYIYMSQQT